MPVCRKLYCCYWILSSAKDTVKEYQEEFQILLDGVHAGKSEDKIFLAEMIPRFLPDFPHLGYRALWAHFKLCDDADKSVCYEAIKGLPRFGTAQLLPQVMKFLTNRLKSADASEHDFLSGILGSIPKDEGSNPGTESAPKRIKGYLALKDGLRMHRVPSAGKWRIARNVQNRLWYNKKHCFREVLGRTSTSQPGLMETWEKT